MKRIVVALILLLGVASAQQQPQQPRAQKAAAGTYQISGRILNGLTGQPLAGANVLLSPVVNPNLDERPLNVGPQRGFRGLRPNNDDVPSVVSGNDGSFSFTGLRAGKYSLSASKRGFLQQVYQQHEEYSTAIVVGPDKDPGELLFTIQPDASLVGRVFDEHNEPVANAQVMLFREGLQNGRRGIYRTQMMPTNDEGLYKFARIRAGKFYVAVEGTPWYTRFSLGRGRVFSSVGMGGGAGGGFTGGVAGQQPADNPELDVAFPLTFYPGVTDAARAEALDLKPGQRETAEFTLTAIPSLHVRVLTQVNPNAQEFTSAMLTRQIFDSSDVGSMGTRMATTAPGVTEISGITAGRYMLQVHVNSPNRGPAPIMAREVDITSDTEINASESPSGVNVTGTLRFEGPAPARDVRLVLRRRGPAPPIQLQVGPKGEISSASPIPPDTYDIFLPGLYQMNQITVTGAKLDGQSIQVGSTDVHLSIIAARSSAHIEGVVEKADKPMSGAMVVLVPADMERPLLYRRDQSDSDGSFVLNNVTPGKYTLIALENGWDLEWAKPDVLKPYLPGGQTVEVAVDGKYNVKVAVQ